MALFGRESDERPSMPPSPTPNRQPAAARTGSQKTTLIATGAKVVGEIGGDTDVMIEGTVEGKIHPSQDVSVGEQGVVHGEIKARRVRVAGKVRGNVQGKESVEILSSGSLEGDVSSPGMVIGDGAFFKGRVEMTGQQPQEASEPKAASRKAEAKPASAAPKAERSTDDKAEQEKPSATGAALSSSEAGA